MSDMHELTELHRPGQSPRLLGAHRHMAVTMMVLMSEEVLSVGSVGM